jgi:DNA-binding XRE family transcriptional regulator
MTKPAPRTVRLRRLSKLIERLRKRAALTQDAAAALIGINRSTWIAMEGGKTSPHRSNVLSIIDKLGASEDEGQELLALLAKPVDPAWMRPLRGALPEAYGSYIDLESEATSIEWYEPLLIPGLLQTERYARAHARAGLPDSSEDQIEAWVTARMHRQAAFTDRAAPLSAVITEAALRYEVGGTDALREQLARLLEADDAANINVHVIPFAGGAHPSMMASFGILSFAQGDPPVVYQESPGGDLFFEEPEDITAFRRIYGRLQEAALAQDETRALITEAIRDLERRSAHDGPRTALA